MNTVHGTTKIKKSAKVIKYQNELREDLARTKTLMAEVGNLITKYREEIEGLRSAVKDSNELTHEITSRLQHLTMETRSLHSKYDEYVSKIDKIEIEIADVLYLNEILYSDVNPYEVVEMITPNKWVVRALDTSLKSDARKNIQNSFCPGGFAGHVDNDYQEWDIYVNEKNPLITVYRGKKNKYFKISGMPMSMTLNPIKFYDFNF